LSLYAITSSIKQYYGDKTKDDDDDDDDDVLLVTLMG
jgi:hypothetical protein